MSDLLDGRDHFEDLVGMACSFAAGRTLALLVDSDDEKLVLAPILQAELMANVIPDIVRNLKSLGFIADRDTEGQPPPPLEKV